MNRSPFGFGAANFYRRILDVQQQFGAQCDGVTDDYLALQAALSASAIYGIPAYIPPVNASGNPSVAMTSRGLTLAANASLIGDGLLKNSGPIIRALAPVTAILTVHTTAGAALNPNNPLSAFVYGLTLDANFQAQNCIYRRGDWLTLYQELWCINALAEPIYGSSLTAPLILSAVTAHVPGGSPAGVTITQPASSQGFSGLSTSPTTVVIKAINGAQFVVSVDGGATFGTYAQTIQTTVNVMYAIGGVPQFWTGLQASFPAGTYAANDTWSITVTRVAGDGQDVNISAQTRFENVNCDTGGIAYCSTPSLVAQYSSSCGLSTLTGGTVTVGPGSNVVSGSGTSFLSVAAANGNRPPRVGDFMWIQGYGNVPIAGVADDSTIIAPSGTAFPSIAGANYVIMARGFAYFEEDIGDTSSVSWTQGHVTNTLSGFRSYGDGGGGFTPTQCRIESSYAGVGWSIGGITSSSRANIAYSPEVKPAAANSIGYYVNKGSGVTLIEPKRLNPNLGQVGSIGGPGYARVFVQGHDYVYGTGADTRTPLYSQLYFAQSLTLVNATDQIPTPSIDTSTTGGTLVRATATSNLTLTNAQTILPPLIDGVVIKIVNMGTNTITFQTAGTNLRMPAATKTLSQYQSATFIGSFPAGTWILDSPA